ncbi:hypothetical protein Pelo_3983 [Pelomyxa schiedti]|nr:hypothetical protein Pelo_3983 [Pelomyxa schiedti]
MSLKKLASKLRGTRLHEEASDVGIHSSTIDDITTTEKEKDKDSPERTAAISSTINIITTPSTANTSSNSSTTINITTNTNTVNPNPNPNPSSGSMIPVSSAALASSSSGHHHHHSHQKKPSASSLSTTSAAQSTRKRATSLSNKLTASQQQQQLQQLQQLQPQIQLQSKRLTQQDFICPLCSAPYTKVIPKIPRLLACGHSFCQECLDLSCKGASGMYHFQCQKCSSHTPRPDLGSAGLPSNHIILDAIDAANALTVAMGEVDSEMAPPVPLTQATSSASGCLNTPTTHVNINSTSTKQNSGPASALSSTATQSSTISSSDRPRTASGGNKSLPSVGDRQQTQMESPYAVIVPAPAVASTCEECKVKDATVYCCNCHGSLCTSCCNNSHTTKVQQKHKRIPIQQIPKRTFLCKEHSNHNLGLYCMQDQILVCPMCSAVGSHKNHQVCSVEEAALEAREQIDMSLNLAQNHLVSMKSAYSNISDVCSTSENAISACTSHVQQTFSELRQALTDRELLLLSELTSRSNTPKFQQYITDLAALISSTRATLERTEHVLALASPLELLTERHKILDSINVDTMGMETLPDTLSNQVPIVTLQDIIPVVMSMGEVKVKAFSRNETPPASLT